MASSPNILFVLADQLGATWLPLYGHPFVSTPHLERFASRSAVFERAISTSPVCTPYRGCLLSGLYPSQTSVLENGQAYPRKVKSLADHLNEASYQTHYLGKWHLSGAPQENRWVAPEDRAGFQNFIGWESHHIDHYAGLIWRDEPEAAIGMPGHETDALTELAITELELCAAADEPVFMLLSYQAPHPPCSPPPAFEELYANRQLAREPNADPEAWFKHEAWNADYGIERFRQLYFGEISHLDAAFGRLMDALERLGLFEDTLIVFTADHGEMAGAHSVFGKGVMYDESLRVPLLIKGPGQESGVRVKMPVSTVDLMPTLLDYAGCPSESQEGISLRSCIEGRPAEPERIVVSEYHNFCATNARWKLVTAVRTLQAQGLYDLAEDPHEMRNRLNEGDCEAIQADLSGALARWQERVLARPDMGNPTQAKQKESAQPWLPLNI